MKEARISAIDSRYLPASTLTTYIITRISVCEAIDHHKIDDGITLQGHNGCG
jgi:hypothetical protein